MIAPPTIFLKDMTAAPARRVKAADISIRVAKPNDLDAIDAIEQRSFIGDRFPRRNLDRLLQSRSALVVLARLGGRPAGYAALLFRKGSSLARLYSIAVDPDARGQGVADALIDAAIARARRAGGDRMRLEMRPSNKAAQRLYERAGFAVLDRKPGYYNDGEDAIRMEKRLSPRAKGDRGAQS